MNQPVLDARPLTFDEEQTQQIDRCLIRLADKVAAPLVMVSDVSGRLILYRGRLSGMQSTGLSALAAASFAAGIEMGNFLGLRNTARFKQQLHEGAVANLYTVEVGHDLLLIIAFTKQTTLGLVRLFAQEARQELLNIAEVAALNRDDSTASMADLDVDFGDEVSSQLDDLFSDF
ncbi:MAG TPA: hypothetical protein VLL52_25825 [Anaerolineae bacterium]|nr:hypothetical protein [Anaerolineae bacterium]